MFRSQELRTMLFYVTDIDSFVFPRLRGTRVLGVGHSGEYFAPTKNL
jgi:hypothetical protein